MLWIGREGKMGVFDQLTWHGGRGSRQRSDVDSGPFLGGSD